MNRLSERSFLMLLAAVQFTHVMDFMIMMPLGPQLMRELQIGPAYFSALVAIYTISSGVVGLFIAPFVDRFDRRKLLLFAYAGFIAGTLACALSPNATALLLARGWSGVFGGLSATMVMAMIGDVVPPERRAAGVGVVMTAFSIAAAAGVPFGLHLAQQFGWEAPFFLLAGMAGVTWIVAGAGLPPVRGHLESGLASRAFGELMRDGNAGRALLFMTVMVFGHFAIIPLLSPYLVYNAGLPERHLFLVYLIGGVLTVFTAPRVGRLADRHGRMRVFSILVIVASAVTLFLTHSGRVPVWAILVSGGAFFVFASGRFVPAQAIMTLAVPGSHRGAFMSLTGVARDLAMGAASALGGWIVTRDPSGPLHHFHWLGWIAVAAAALSVVIGRRVRVQDMSPPMAAPGAEPAHEHGSISLATQLHTETHNDNENDHRIERSKL